MFRSLYIYAGKALKLFLCNIFKLHFNFGPPFTMKDDLNIYIYLTLGSWLFFLGLFLFNSLLVLFMFYFIK